MLRSIIEMASFIKLKVKMYNKCTIVIIFSDCIIPTKIVNILYNNINNKQKKINKILIFYFYCTKNSFPFQITANDLFTFAQNEFQLV